MSSCLGRRASASRCGRQLIRLWWLHAHVVLSEAPAPVEPSGPARPPVSAHTEPLRELASRYHDVLIEADAADVVHVAFTASAGRSHRDPSARHPREREGDFSGPGLWKRPLRTVEQPRARRTRNRRAGGPGALLSSSRGSTPRGDGPDADEELPAVPRTPSCVREAAPHAMMDRPLRDIVDPMTANLRMERTRPGQPALFAIEYCSGENWRSWGIEPAAVSGIAGEHAGVCRGRLPARRRPESRRRGGAVDGAFPTTHGRAAIARVDRRSWPWAIRSMRLYFSAVVGAFAIVATAMRWVREACRRDRIATHAHCQVTLRVPPAAG